MRDHTPSGKAKDKARSHSRRIASAAQVQAPDVVETYPVSKPGHTGINRLPADLSSFMKADGKTRAAIEAAELQEIPDA